MFRKNGVGKTTPRSASGGEDPPVVFCYPAIRGRFAVLQDFFRLTESPLFGFIVPYESVFFELFRYVGNTGIAETFRKYVRMSCFSNEGEGRGWAYSIE